LSPPDHLTTSPFHPVTCANSQALLTKKPRPSGRRGEAEPEDRGRAWGFPRPQRRSDALLSPSDLSCPVHQERSPGGEPLKPHREIPGGSLWLGVTLSRRLDRPASLHPRPVRTPADTELSPSSPPFPNPWGNPARHTSASCRARFDSNTEMGATSPDYD
jgi:hypothetical protein